MYRTSEALARIQIMREAERGRYYECLAIAAKMKADGTRPDLSIYDALMSAAAREAMWLDAWAILDDMVLIGLTPSAAIFNHLIHAQRLRSSPYLWKVVEKMNELGVAPNSKTFTLIIERFVADGNLELALQYFYAMRAWEFTPELHATQSIVILAAELGLPRLALDLVTWYEEHSTRRFDHVVWTKCLIASADSLYMDGVAHCWELLVQELNVMPDEGLCLSVLHTAARHGLPDLGTDVLRVLKLVGAPWKEHHFAPLVEAFCRTKQIKEALMTLDIMRTNGIEPLTGTTRPILDTMKNDTDAVDATWAVIDDLHKDGKRIDLTALRVLIQASVGLGDLQRAVGAYKSFAEYGATPDLATFNLLLEGCVTAGHRDLGDLLLADMKGGRIKPDQDTYKHFIFLCLTQAIYEDAFFYLEEMKSAGHVPPSDVYEALIMKCLSAGDARYTIAMEEMRGCGYGASPRVLDAIGDFTRQTAQSPNHLPDTPEDVQPLGLDGAAQRFIETGGLSSPEEIIRIPST